MTPSSLSLRTQLKDIPPWQADDESDNEDDRLYHSQSAYQYQYENEDDLMDYASSMTSSPSIPDDNIDFDSVYALHAFVATVEGQANANKGDALLLMEDENTYWWLVEVLHSGEIGYIPAENIETPYERLARLNKHRNVDITSPIEDDFNLQHKNAVISTLSRKHSKNLFVEFGPARILEFNLETEEEESDEGEGHEYQWEDMDDQQYYEDGYEADYQERYQAYDDLDNQEEQLEYQPERVRNLLYERIKDRQLEKKQSSDVYQMIDESHNISTMESIESESISSSDEDDIQIIRKRQEQPRTSTKYNPIMHQALCRPIPASRLAVPRASRSSLEIIELGPPAQSATEPTKRDGMTRSKSRDSIQSASTQLTVLRIFAGNIRQGTGFKTVMVNPNTTAQELVKQAMVKFHIAELECDLSGQAEYYATVKGIDGHESTLDPEDKPLSIYQTLTNHLTTPMPSVEHIKRLSNTQIHVTRLGVMVKDKSQHGDSHFGEDSIIRFYLHRRMKRNSGRVEQMYIKISLFLENSGPSLLSTVRSNSTFSLTGRKKKYVATMTEDANRVDKIICVNMNDLVSEVIYLALDKFHITNGVPDGPQDNGYIPEDLVPYRLLIQVRGSEVELNYRETMNNVMECHRLSNQQQGHLTFILRKASDPLPINESRKLSPLRNLTPSRGVLEISPSPGLERQRKPSILDILMEPSKESTASQQSISDIVTDPSRTLEKQSHPFHEDNQRGTVDRKFSNSSHLLSDISESRKSSFASLISGDNPYKTASSVSTTPTSPLDVPADQSRQMSLASLASSSSIVSDDAQKSASMQALNSSGADHITTEKRDKSFTSALRKIVPWSAKSKRQNDVTHNTVMTSHSADADDNRSTNHSCSKPLRSTLTVDGYSDRSLSQFNSQRDIVSNADTLTPKLKPIAEPKAEKPPTQQPEYNSRTIFNTITPPLKSSEDNDSTNYATYAKWLNHLPCGYNPSTDTKDSKMDMPIKQISGSDAQEKHAYESWNAEMDAKDAVGYKAPGIGIASSSLQAKEESKKSIKVVAEPVHNPELGDLSYLIQNGIGFLETKESSKWEEDGGYEFHPWNRPKSSKISESKTPTDEVESLSVGEKSMSRHNPTLSEDACLASANVLKAPVIESIDMEKEFARIVAAHIVF